MCNYNFRKGDGDVEMDKELLEYIKNGIWLLFGSGVLFEIAPIKFSPISTFLSWLGEKLNKDVKKQIESIQTDISTVKVDLQEHKVESQRREILDFANALMRNEKKTKENFDYIIKLHDKYIKYIKEKNMENGQVNLAYDYIENKYRECQQSNGFM